MFSAGHAIIPHILSILLTSLEVNKSSRKCRCECGTDHFLIEVEVFIDSSSVRAIQYCHSYDANWIPQTTNLITSGPHITNLSSRVTNPLDNVKLKVAPRQRQCQRVHSGLSWFKWKIFLVPHRSRAVQYCLSYDTKWIPQTINVITESGPHILILVNFGYKCWGQQTFKRNVQMKLEATISKRSLFSSFVIQVEVFIVSWSARMSQYGHRFGATRILQSDWIALWEPLM